jgi:hypothetical protein
MCTFALGWIRGSKIEPFAPLRMTGEVVWAALVSHIIEEETFLVVYSGLYKCFIRNSIGRLTVKFRHGIMVYSILAL